MGKKMDSGHYKQDDDDEREAWVGDLWFNWLGVSRRRAVRVENRASCEGDKGNTPLPSATHTHTHTHTQNDEGVGVGKQ